MAGEIVLSKSSAMADEIALGKSPPVDGEIEKVIMSNENRGRVMKEGWKYKMLSQVCEIKDRFRKPITKSKRESGK